MRFFILLVTTIFVNCSIAFAQNKTIDSLRKIINTTKIDTVKANAYFELAYLTKGSQIRLQIADSAYSLYEKHNHIKGMVNILLDKSFYISEGRPNIEESIHFNHKAELLYEKHKSDLELNIYGIILAQTAKLYSDQEEYFLAADNYLKASEVFKNAQDLRNEIKTFHNLANIYNKLKDNDKSIEINKTIYQKSLALNDTALIARSLVMLVSNYYNIERYDSMHKILDLLENHLPYLERTGAIDLSYYYCGRGNYEYEITKKYEMAIAYYNKALSYLHENITNHLSVKAETYNS
jgi:two-component system, NarL family, sensor kinase